MGASIDAYNAIWGGYVTPEEAMAADQSSTDKTLGAVISMLAELYLEKRAIRQELDFTVVTHGLDVGK